MDRVINIWADVICPFCYLGSVWAEEAARELHAELRWLPFEIHPETPAEGAPKPVPPERFALETAELVRAQRGDDAAGTFYQDASRAFFAERADISKREVIVPIVERFGIAPSDVDAAWSERRFRRAVDAFMKEARFAGVGGVPAMGWPHGRAIVGMMRAADLVERLRNAPERTSGSCGQ